MNRILLTIVFLLNISLYAQEYEHYTLDIESKFKTKTKVDFIIKYSDTSNILEKDFVLKKISNTIKDSLKNYSTTEIYFDKRLEVNEVLKNIVIDKIQNNETIILDALISFIEISEETRMLYEQFLWLKQHYLEVELEIYNRIKEIEKELESGKKMTRFRKKELEKELFTLNNVKYIQALYDKKMKIIDIKQN